MEAQTNASLVIQEVRFGERLESSLEKVVTDMHCKVSKHVSYIHTCIDLWLSTAFHTSVKPKKILPEF